MREIILKRIDNEIANSKNEHNLKISPPVVIGRGPTFKCGEKKISRNHGTLDWDDDGILITSTHINPLFKKVNGKKQKIMNGHSSTLFDGDEFGLLEDTFWYKVVIHKSMNGVGSIKEKSEVDGPLRAEGSPLETETLVNAGKEEKNSTEEILLEKKQNLNSSNATTREEEPCNEERAFDSKSANTQTKSEGKNSSDLTSDKGCPSTIAKNKRVASDIKQREESTPVSEEASYSSHRNRTLPNWMLKCSGPDGPSSSKSKFTESSQNSQANLKKSTIQNESPRKQRVQHGSKKKPNKPRSPKKSNQYHAISQEFDEIKDEESKGSSKLHTLSSEGEEEATSAETVKKVVSVPQSTGNGTSLTHGSKKKPNKPRTPKKSNQYHAISQEFDEIKDEKTKGSSKLPTVSCEGEEEATSAKTVKKVVSVPQSTGNETSVKNPLKRKRIDEDSPTKIKQHGLNDESSSKNNVHHTLSSDEESNSLADVDSKMAKPTSSEKSTPKKTEDESPKKGSSPRKSCYFGAQCYRKNPLHKTTMAHPGDDDYVSPNEPVDDSDDDRPQCEFGVECYRKNPQHRKDFKHTRNPQPQRRVKRKAKLKQKQAGMEGDSEDEYDFDDPFLNDDSSDDYAPTDSSDSDYDMKDAEEEGDTKRMLKEAKKFVKKRI